MLKIFRNILGVVAGLLAGSLVNMGLVLVGGQIVPAPTGADVSSMESLKEAAHLFEGRHFIFPLLAHAGGALAGGFTAALIGASHRLALALIVGLMFMIGGIISIFILPAPFWYIVLDLASYLPMSWLGWRLGTRRQPA